MLALDRRFCCKSHKIARNRSATWSKKGFRNASGRSVAVQSLDGAKPNTDPKTNPNLKTNSKILTLFPNSNPKIIKKYLPKDLKTPTNMAPNGV